MSISPSPEIVEGQKPITVPAVAVKADELHSAIRALEAKSTMVITDEVDAEDADAYLNGELHPMRARVVEFFKAPKETAHKWHQAVCAAEKATLAMIDPMIGTISGTLTKWLRAKQAAEEQRVREAQAALEREAEEVRETEIEQAEATGSWPEDVDAIAEAPIIRTAVAPPAPARVGSSMLRKQRLVGVVTDKGELIKHIAANLASMQGIVKIEQAKLDAYLNIGDENQVVGGVRIERPDAKLRKAGR
jgi:hypothetical protein